MAQESKGGPGGVVAGMALIRKLRGSRRWEIACRVALAQTMTPTIRVTDISSAGLELSGPNSRGFDERVRRVAPSVGDAVLLCKPQLAILSNHSQKTAVAYAVRFVVTDRRGEQDRLTSQRKYPN